MKKVISLFTAVAMATTMSVCAFAADPEHTITITPKDYDEESTGYVGYQVFTGSINEHDIWTTPVAWGDGLSLAGQSALLADFNTAFTAAEPEGATETDDADTVEEMMEIMKDFTPEQTKDFADLVGKQVKTNAGTQIDFTKDPVAQTWSSPLVVDGYYFVKTVDGAKLYTDYILQVAGSDVDVTSKTDLPTVNKKVQEDKDGSWGEYADYSVGQDVSFRLVGTLPKIDGIFDKYDYVYSIMDNLQDDKFGTPKEIKVYLVDDNTATSETIATTFDAKGKTEATGFIIDTDAGTDVNSGYEYDFRVYTDDLATSNPGDANEFIVVEYKAELIAADIATALNNDVQLKYSNNPNESNSYEYDEDNAKVYTFDFNVDKYYMNGENETDLAGAEFELSDVDNNVISFVGGTGSYTKATTTDADTTTTLVDDGAGNYSLKGLDEGTYFLTETKAPDGYNPLTAAIEITVSAVYTDGELTGYVANIKGEETNTVAMDPSTIKVENKSGLTLPETGGIGTTIFYVIGGLMMACATVVLVSRKRMAK